ncbi:MAG: DNA polymerase Y family protein [Planctomycetota bacterium]
MTARSTGSDPHEKPVVVLVSLREGKQLVAVACEKAEEAGVRAGMTLAHAGSLLANRPVLVQPFTPDVDAANLTKLAHWATRFSPVVAVDQPDGLLLDIAGCEHLFGGEEPLAERIASSLEQLGFPCRLGVAPTFACAHAVARYGNQHIDYVSRDRVHVALAPLPVAALQVEQTVCEALNEVAVEKIGQLYPIPREELASRFGHELLRRLDQALGDVAEHIEPIVASQPIAVAKSFDGPVLHVEIVEAVVRELLSELVAELDVHALGVSLLTIKLRRISVDPVDLSLSLTYPSRDCRHLWSLIQPKLERVHLGYGVEEIVLQAARTMRLVPDQKELWSHAIGANSKVDGFSLGKLVDLLVDRLGPQAVTQALPREGYLPEEAFCRHSVDGQSVRKMEGVYFAARPSLLFARPEPVKVVAIVPDGPPAWLEWRGQACVVRSSHGPERIASPWWEHNRTQCTRDYYEVQDDAGRWLWVFRNRESGHWFVHGQWA